MCGLLVEFDSSGCDESKFRDALNRQSHRGPDSCSYQQFNNGRLFMGANRLAIIDIDGGSQPMNNPEMSLTIVFNGEIFNSMELRQELESQGVVFVSSHSDTEVVLRLYEKYEEEFLTKLNGMFAFVIYDNRRNTLFIARDRFGIKPIYIMYSKSHIAMASEINTLKAILPHTTLKNNSLVEFIEFGYILNPDTVYEQISEIPPATYEMIDLGSGRVFQKKWWNHVSSPDLSLNYEDSCEMVKNEILSAVSRWITADVPVAISLSSGIDSTILFLAIRKLGFKITPITVGYRGAEYDQWDESKIVAKVWQENHVETQVTYIEKGQMLNSLPSLVGQFGQPYGGGLPSWKLYEFAQNSFPVIITGVGGDEIFGNYNRAFNLISSNFQSNRGIEKIMSTMYKSHEKINKGVFDLEVDTMRYEKYLKKLNTKPDLDFESDLESFCISTQLVDEFLFMTDVLSMKYSIEARTPFLDSKLFDKITAIPLSFRTSSNNYKKILIDAFKKDIPQEIISGSKKGFSMPLSIWLRGELREDLIEMFMDRALVSKSKLNHKFICSELKEFLAGSNDKILFIWRVYMLLKWLSLSQS